ncbi:LmeA family phospholipid-binding protein [Agromyces aerolatus]|uniref:LmeA family phospholipid-binding protein n=1 Tax=Agromyces sp. LY-1074 TaxID=3074080 RepID=UPI002861ACE2|nr:MULTISPECIES: DUF2993 domain-containing protein [unclassified Agromyces]MDR5701805.1 DUF2993 domain-containing protein [Agromyces sp. LY-1074]MDR5707525.1 DUF2993 domain-containing protein [Agromyces sp. LY-1358]
MTDPFATTQVFDEPDASRQRRGPRRAARGWIVTGIVVAVLVVLVVVADLLVRSLAQTAIEQGAEQSLPEGVSGEVTASIGGFSVLGQLIAGRADEVRLSAPELVVDGTPLAADVVARDVPLDLSQPVGRVEADVRLTQQAVDSLALEQGVVGDLTLGDGVVGYTGTIDVLGVPVGYTATAEPEAAGDRVLLRPVGAEVSAGGFALDVSGVIDAVLGGGPVEICVADRLPAGVQLSDVDVSDGAVDVRLVGTGLVLDRASLSSTGSC